jgi:hypothetical protein
VPLTAERLVGNVRALRDRLAGVPMESGYDTRKLHSNARHELTSISNVSTASREEETSPEALLLKVPACDGAGNGGLPCAS